MIARGDSAAPPVGGQLIAVLPERNRLIRSLFLALGLYCFLIGAEALVIDKAVLVSGNDTASDAIAPAAPRYREISPPDWAPWSLLSVGAVVMLYTFTLPAKLKS